MRLSLHIKEHDSGSFDWRISALKPEYCVVSWDMVQIIVAFEVTAHSTSVVTYGMRRLYTMDHSRKADCASGNLHARQ